MDKDKEMMMKMMQNQEDDNLNQPSNDSCHIPTHATIKLTQAQRFTIGLARLAEECGLNDYNCSMVGLSKLFFNDGSSIGHIRLLYDSGIMDESTFQEAVRRYDNLAKK